MGIGVEVSCCVLKPMPRQFHISLGLRPLASTLLVPLPQATAVAVSFIDPKKKFLPFRFRPETGPTIQTLALWCVPQIAPYEAEKIHGAVRFGYVIVAA